MPVLMIQFQISCNQQIDKGQEREWNVSCRQNSNRSQVVQKEKRVRRKDIAEQLAHTQMKVKELSLFTVHSWFDLMY